MTFSFEDLLSINDILADALVNVNDEEFKLFTPGWYNRQIRSGLEKLNYQAPFVKTHKDISIEDSLIVPMPKGAYNIVDMFLWTGEDCVIESSHRVFHKDHQTKGKGYSYTANKKTGQSDSFISYTGEHYEYFYTVNMGNIMLSEMCANYDNIRIIYEGFPNIEIDSVKYIPPFCREVLIGYVTERVFFAMKSRDVAYRPLWIDAKQDLYVQLGTTKESKWDTAVGLLKKIDTKKRNDIQEYLSYMNY